MKKHKHFLNDVVISLLDKLYDIVISDKDFYFSKLTLPREKIIESLINHNNEEELDSQSV